MLLSFIPTQKIVHTHQQKYLRQVKQKVHIDAHIEYKHTETTNYLITAEYYIRNHCEDTLKLWTKKELSKTALFHIIYAWPA